MYRKNVASQHLPFCLVNASSGAALTGATVTARRSLDGGAQASATGSVSELGNGQYNLALSQADTNGNNIGILLTATSAIPVHFTIVTTAADPTDSVRFGLTALPNVAAGASGGLPTGNASGQVAVGSFANDAITAAAIATDAIGSAELAASAVTEIQTGLATSAALATVQADTDDIQTRLPAALVGGKIDANVGTVSANAITAAALDPTAGAEIADAVWDETLAGHLTAGSTGNALNAAGSAGDPWSTAVPGAYGAGSAGFILGTNLNATVSSRASQTSVDDLPTNAELATSQAAADDATLAAIAGLPAAPSAAVIAAQIIATVLTELAQAEPADTPTVGQALMLPYMMLAQGGTMNATTGESTYRNGAGVVFAKRVLSDDGNVLTEGKLISGP